MIEALFFYLFSAVMLGAGAMVVISRNPVYSVSVSYTHLTLPTKA